ncbi:hypothetical protein AJ79_08332 [Helicocarpus griseus UAMH5409]|uniref:Cutinase n=1 Tax=Helicocarpus griseus UAMH5409 TaxID=1447875 RepID=A0A2B7WU87_9EURO|nr:hypothetical protein AJ79_08332 [Helicocarpus griseus UAMH5409]
MVRIAFVAAVFAAVATAAPASNPHALQRRQTCTGQSCVIADISRSTGRQPSPDAHFEGGTAEGTACIKEHLTILQSQGRIPANDSLEVPEPRRRHLFGGGLGGSEAECKPNTLLYARGTGESGAMGMSVGPRLEDGLSRTQWNVQGVLDGYPADMAGNNCIGLNGGIAMMELIEQTAQECPETKIVVSGYSQGAMVAHNGVAFAKPEAKSQIVGLVVFGDPFNGAPIKEFDSSKIKTFCHEGDGVCSGQFGITFEHLTYAFRDTPAAIEWMEQAVGGS